MLRWIVGTSLRFRLLVIVIAAVTMYLGIRQLQKMPVDVLPEFSRQYVEIQTEALGLSAEEMEAMITTPLEADMLNGAPWVEEIHSESIPGLSRIRLYFEPGTDIMDARQMTQERLTEVFTLPGVAKSPVILQPVSSANRCMKIGLSSDSMSLMQMSVLARWTIRPRLMGVQGVANVSIWGQRERQLQVQVDPKKLHDMKVTLSQIVSTTGNALWVSPLTFLDAAVPGTGGFIDTPNQRLTIQHVFPISTAEQLAEVPVKGTSLKLGDVTNVVEDHQLLIGDAVVNDAPALMLVIEKFPWATTLDVTKGVEKALDALRPGLAGIEMDSSLFRPATFIEVAMQNLTTSLFVALVLVAVVLLAFLNSWQSALVSLIAIVAAAVTAIMVMTALGVEMNMLVLAGLMIALGVVIDDAIVCTQNVRRRLSQHRAQTGSEESFAWVVREATVEIQSVLLYATAIVLLAISPVIFMQGISAAFFQPLTYAYGLAVICSLLVALVITPVLCIVLFRHSAPVAEVSRLEETLRSAYDKIVAPTLAHPAPAFAMVAVLLIAGLVVLPQIRQESLFPKFKETDVMVAMDARPGTSHPAMSRAVTHVSRELRAIPGVKNVSAHIGRAITSDAVAEVSSSELWVSIDPTADYDATIAELERVVEGYPGFDRDVEGFLEERVTEELAGEERGMVVRVYGDDFTLIGQKAEEIKRMLTKVDGLNNPMVEAPETASRVEISPNLEKCKVHGIKPGEVRRAAAILLSSMEVGYLFEEQKIFEVVVWGTPEIRDSLTNVKELLIETPVSGLVQLQELADIRLASGPVEIQREAVARYLDVVAEVRGRDLAAIGNDVQRGLAQIKFPLEYRAEILGETAERLATQRRVLSFAAAAAFGIFLIYQAAFGSWWLAALMMLVLPLALVGGAVSAVATGGVLSFGSILGFIALLAIAVRNGMLLVSRYQSLSLRPKADEVDADLVSFQTISSRKSPLDDGGKYDGQVTPELVLEGTHDRFLPTILTAIAMACAFLPFVVFGNIPGHEIMQPMAIVVLGGLITTTLVNLYLLPVLYLWLKPQPQVVFDADVPASTLRGPHAVPAKEMDGRPELAGQSIS
jgi:Cu/Ag efflux pump CusA